MNNIKGKRLLVLGGSRVSCEIVKAAQSMGIYVIVTDWYPIEDSPAKQICDKAFMVSTADVDAIVELIKEEHIDGVITGFTDSVLPYYAEICEKASLPCYGTKEQFEIFTNKKKYKELCKKFTVPTIEEYDIDISCLDEDTNNIKFPVLVKPADNSGARGITICNNIDELRQAYIKALNFSQNKEVIVERYINGKEVTVFWLFQDGNISLTAIGNRHIKHNQEDVIALPVGYTFPSIYIQSYQQQVESQVKKMLNSLNIKNGMMFMQCLIDNEECLVYDIGYRLTGSLEYKLLDKICNYNPLEMMIRFALTGEMKSYSKGEEMTPYWNRYGCNVTFLIKPGTIDKIWGLDEVMKIPGVIDAVLAHTEGEEILEVAKGTLKQIVLRVFATAESKKELKSIIDKVYSCFNVFSPEGENMVLEGLDTVDIGGTLL